MINVHRPGQALIIIVFCLSAIACASSPDVDRRPKLLISAEKSLELGVSNYNENNFAKAEAHFDRALFLYRNIDNPTGIISSCLNIAKTKLSSGHVNTAKAYVEQAKIIIEREQINGFNSHLTVIESSIAIEDNQIDKARQILDKLLNKTPGDAPLRTAALQNRTRIAFLENNDTANWVKQYEDALNKPGQNSILNKARLLRFKAALETNMDSAVAKYTEALKLYRKAAHSPGIAATLTEWATPGLSGTDYQNATDKLERALFIRINLHDRGNSKKILALLARSYKKPGSTNQSERASYWQKKLDNETFEEWDMIRFEFENYPR